MFNSGRGSEALLRVLENVGIDEKAQFKTIAVILDFRTLIFDPVWLSFLPAPPHKRPFALAFSIYFSGAKCTNMGERMRRHLTQERRSIFSGLEAS